MSICKIDEEKQLEKVESYDKRRTNRDITWIKNMILIKSIKSMNEVLTTISSILE